MSLRLGLSLTLLGVIVFKSEDNIWSLNFWDPSPSFVSELSTLPLSSYQADSPRLVPTVEDTRWKWGVCVSKPQIAISWVLQENKPMGGEWGSIQGGMSRHLSSCTTAEDAAGFTLPDWVQHAALEKDYQVSGRQVIIIIITLCLRTPRSS